MTMKGMAKMENEISPFGSREEKIAARLESIKSVTEPNKIASFTFENIKNLYELMKENPDLPVILCIEPGINTECAVGYTTGYIFRKAVVDECIMYGYELFDNRYNFKEYYCKNKEFELEYFFNYQPMKFQNSISNREQKLEDFNDIKKIPTEANKYIDKVADIGRIRAIFVYINTTDDC